MSLSHYNTGRRRMSATRAPLGTFVPLQSKPRGRHLLQLHPPVDMLDAPCVTYKCLHQCQNTLEGRNQCHYVAPDRGRVGIYAVRTPSLGEETDDEGRTW